MSVLTHNKHWASLSLCLDLYTTIHRFYTLTQILHTQVQSAHLVYTHRYCTHKCSQPTLCTRTDTAHTSAVSPPCVHTQILHTQVQPVSQPTLCTHTYTAHTSAASLPCVHTQILHTQVQPVSQPTLCTRTDTAHTSAVSPPCVHTQILHTQVQSVSPPCVHTHTDTAHTSAVNPPTLCTHTQILHTQITAVSPPCVLWDRMVWSCDSTLTHSEPHQYRQMPLVVVEPERGLHSCCSTVLHPQGPQGITATHWVCHQLHLIVPAGDSENIVYEYLPAITQQKKQFYMNCDMCVGRWKVI